MSNNVGVLLALKLCKGGNKKIIAGLCKLCLLAYSLGVRTMDMFTCLGITLRAVVWLVPFP